MRPLELTIEGFRSHRERTTFEWRGRRLVGIVGPIGAGKSSILDAVSFALYGKTPAVEGATRSLIHQLCTECHVELVFEVDGQVWRAVRALRRKGASGHQLEHLASDDEGAEVLDRVTGDDPMRKRVEQLLGMDFKAFCRSVLLAQNRFSEFLRATPADRDKVLKGVFGYERLDAALVAARSRLTQAETRLEVLADERTRIDEAREGLDAAREAATTAARRHGTLEAAAPEVTRWTEEEASALQAAGVSASLAERLEELVSSLPAPDAIEADIAAAEGAEALVAAAKEHVDATLGARDAAEAALADVRARIGDRERFRSFERLVEQQDREVKDLERARAAATDAEAGVAAARDVADVARGLSSDAADALTAADRARTEADRAVAAARRTLLDAQRAEMAHELRTGLTVGEPCPVCEQIVKTEPSRAKRSRAPEAEKSLAAAEADQRRAREDKERAAATAAANETAATAAVSRVEEAAEGSARANQGVVAAEAALRATQGHLAEWLGEGESDAREALRAREAELDMVERASVEAASALEEARQSLDRARSDAGSARSALTTLAMRLAGAWGRIGEDREVRPGPNDLRAAFAELGRTIAERHDAALADRERESRRATDAAASLAALLIDLGVSSSTEFTTARTAADAARVTTAQAVEELESRIAHASDLERRILETERARDLAKRLSEDLRPVHFLGFLLQEERTDLAELGSHHFEELTDGAYRFSDDDTFSIVDMNAASQVRNALSLSGGETFLASLALALALAEMVARGGGRLDAFFLDEGFGSLDPEHLDRAMDGVGRLVADGGNRLVVLVSHVEQMKQTLEDLIVLDKDDRTGDTRVVSGARPMLAPDPV
jgi:exonuclease SbcC